MQSSLLEGWEVLLSPIYLLIAFATVFLVAKKDRRLYTYGLSAKMIGIFGFTFVYLVYYGGGDTISYYKTALAMVNLIYYDMGAGLNVYFNGYDPQFFSHFNRDTGYPLRYIVAEQGTLMVSKAIVPFLILSFKSYLLASIMIGTVSFLATWKLFELFRHLVPSQTTIGAIAALFVPSILFWGGGISKDTISFASMCYFTYGMYWILIRRRFRLWPIVLSLISIALIIIIKPYIFLVIFPGTLVWIFYSRIQSISNKLLRLSLVPIIIVASTLIFAATFSAISDSLGAYSTENIINKAIVSQEDFKREYYGTNSFDIGTIDPSIIGILSKFPIATFYGFYGPTLLSINNIVMVFSALENTALLLLTIWVFVRRNPLQTMNRILSDPFLTFCFMFSILFAFGIGLTTPNYGALVRFKIPLLPFFTMLLLVLYTKAEVNPKPSE